MQRLLTEEYGPICINDALSALIGSKIASGTYREVYECALDKTWVVKIEARNGEGGVPQFCNVSEMDIWRESENTKWRRWLAPCIHISEYGSTLIMRRTQPLGCLKLPKTMPSFLADLKPQNFGLLDGRIVAHDYGNHSIHRVAQAAHRMVPAKWHDGAGGFL